VLPGVFARVLSSVLLAGGLGTLACGRERTPGASNSATTAALAEAEGARALAEATAFDLTVSDRGAVLAWATARPAQLRVARFDAQGDAQTSSALPLAAKSVSDLAVAAGAEGLSAIWRETTGGEATARGVWFEAAGASRPLELGADGVVHSTTKYLGGHSDVVGGAAIVRDPALHEKVRFVQNAVGAVPGPFDCFLVHRGLRTLHLRVAAHDANGMAVSAWLKEQAGVEDVRWPGFGGMVSFRHPDAIRIASSTSVFSLAESLGGVESLIEVPQAMTHQSVEDSSAAVPADLVRLSCGIEASVDLIADLAQALAP